MIDEGNREALRIACGSSIPSTRLLRVLEELIDSYDKLPVIRLYNGPEMKSAKFVSSVEQHSIGLRYIQPGKPNQNAFVERFNQSVRQEVHNDWLFDSMGQAPMIIGGWRIEYNTVRSHESLVRMRRKRSCLGSLTMKSLLLTCLLYGEV